MYMKKKKDRSWMKLASILLYKQKKNRAHLSRSLIEKESL